MKMTRWISGFLAVVLLLGGFGSMKLPVMAEDTETQPELVLTRSAAKTYAAYLAEYGPIDDRNTPESTIEIPASCYESIDAADAYSTDYMGKSSCLYWEKEGGSVTWRFQAEEEGYYQLTLNLCGKIPCGA